MIGPKTLDTISNEVRGMLYDYQEDLQQAYATNQDPFTITISVKLKPITEGDQIDINLNFVTGRVKSTVTRIVNEDQMSFLGDQEA